MTAEGVVEHRALNKTIVRRFYDEYLNSGDMDHIGELVAYDLRQHSMAIPPGREGLGAFMAKRYAAFPDLNYLVLDMVAEGDKVASRVGVRGAQTGAFFGHPPSGRRIDFVRMDLFRIEDGMIVEQWDACDRMTLYHQLELELDNVIQENYRPHPSDPPAPPIRSTSNVADVEVNKEIVRSLFDDHLSRGRMDIDGLVREDYKQHSVLNAPEGREGLKTFVAYMTEVFPDLHFAVEDMLAEGDRVVLRGRISGTWKGEFMGLPGNGKRFAVAEIDFFRLENGMIAEHWDSVDTLLMYKQLGLM